MKTSYDIFGQIEPSLVYLAKPGHRIIGVLNGIDESSARLELNLNNTSTLEFTVQRIIDGEINPLYEKVSQHYELYVTNFGWYKINEEPTLQGNGNTESKSVRAESAEIELQQYDLVGFEINTGSEASWEMMAPDNTYELDGFKLPRENVKFYRPTDKLEELSDAFSQAEGSTVSDLQTYLYEYPEILSSPRIDFVYDAVDNAIMATIADYQQQGKSTAVLEQLIGTTAKQRDDYKKTYVMNMLTVYADMRKYIQIEVDQDGDWDTTYTIQEVIDREIERQNRLSFLWLVLHEHGWKVGYVDSYVDPNGTTAADREKLAGRIGKFNVDSQDIYSFLTQEAAQFYRCMFVFDTDNYLVNAYKIENIGFDTNIFLSFHSIQNSVTRNSDRPLYTVYHVAGADDLDPRQANYGLDTVEDLSYFMTTDHFSQDTIDKYNAWKEYYDDHLSDYIDMATEYRELTEKRDELYDRVPLDAADTAQYSTFKDAELVEEEAKCRAYMAGYEKTYVDENNEFDIDLMREVSPTDYSHYIMLRDQIIPNIEIELYNRQLPSDKDNRDFLDGYIYDFDTYGQSYGVAELKAQMTKLENAIKVLRERGYDEPPEDEDPFAIEQHELYEKYLEAYEEAEDAYDERLGEYNDVLDEITALEKQMLDLKDAVSKENPQFGFTVKELWLLDKYMIHTDYINDNILVTSITTNDQWLQTEYELILDAKEQLYSDAHPQYNFETTQDNLLLIPEFQEWHESLGVGNFIRVAMRDDYQVKLRIITIGLNPFMIDPTIDISFSNMVQYASKRDDYVSLMENGRSSGKNQIKSKYGVSTSSSKNSVEVDSNLILKIINNGMFSGYMGSFNSAITGDAIGATAGAIPGIVATQIDAAEINVNKIVGEEADFERLFANYIDSDYIVTEVLRAGTADIERLQAKIVTSDTIIAGIADVSEEQMSKFNILADSAFLEYLEANIITASEIDVNDLKAKLATIDVADIEELYADNAFIQSLQTLSSTSATSTITDAYIYNAVAGKIAVADLAAGDITISDSMRILSENGNLIMSGSALQILGEDSSGNPYVGVQLGYATNGQPSLVLRNEDGSVIIDPTGITQDAIADGLIINNMIHDGTIQKGKLGFSVVEANQQGGIDISQVYDGSGGLWGAQYTTFKQGTEQAIEDLTDSVESASYRLYIEAPRGKNLRGSNITLNAVLYKNSVDVTNQFNASCFVWTRHSLDSYGDEYWNESHSTGAKTITITGNDVNIEAEFECCFQANGVTVTSSNGGE